MTELNRPQSDPTELTAATDETSASEAKVNGDKTPEPATESMPSMEQLLKKPSSMRRSIMMHGCAPRQMRKI